MLFDLRKYRYLSNRYYSKKLLFSGRAYHVVVEWAPMQKYKVQKAAASIPKSGTIESDPSYIEFLEKLEKEKNVANVSEYFMETDGMELIFNFFTLLDWTT